MVALFQNRKAVVDRMRPCQTAAFKADAAEVSVSFDNTLQRIGHHASLRGKACLLAFRQQGIIAQARQLSAATVDCPPAMLVALAS